jgi:hypothetical protein
MVWSGEGGAFAVVAAVTGSDEVVEAVVAAVAPGHEVSISRRRAIVL